MHTPGPWNIGFDDGSGRGSADDKGGIYITSNRIPLAGQGLPFCVVSGAGDDWGIQHGVTRMEDALLIVAAPDLLELLREYDEVTRGIGRDVEWGRLHERTATIIKKATTP